MRFRLVPKSSTLDDLELLYVFVFSRKFASIRRLLLYIMIESHARTKTYLILI